MVSLPSWFISPRLPFIVTLTSGISDIRAYSLCPIICTGIDSNVRSAVGLSFAMTYTQMTQATSTQPILAMISRFLLFFMVRLPSAESSAARLRFRSDFILPPKSRMAAASFPASGL